MKVSELINQLKELPGDAIVMDYSDGDGNEVLHVKYDAPSQTVWMSGDIPLSGAELQMSTEKHLAAILTAWNTTDGYKIYPELHDALRAAELDFDGVEFEGG